MEPAEALTAGHGGCGMSAMSAMIPCRCRERRVRVPPRKHDVPSRPPVWLYVTH